MNRKSIGGRSLGDPLPEADWARFDAITDEDIDRAVADDSDAPPLIDESWLANARIVEPEPKVPVTIRLDRDVVDFFKDGGPGYQTRMNAVLRAYVAHHRKAG